jgi:hypothetical protein
MRRLALAVPLAIGLVCGAYTIIYLVRWEWNRAIIAGLFFVAVELVFVAMVVVDRLRAVEARLDDLAARPLPAPTDTAVRDAIADAAPAPRDHFGWLRDQVGRTSVFLPILLGAGVVASSLAWLVEHVARATLSPVRERRLADRLGGLRPPTGGFLDATPPPPPKRSHPVRRALVVVGVVVLATGGALGTAAGIDFVADRTQSRPDTRAAGVETHIEIQLYGAVVAHDAERAFGHLWSLCTGPDVFRLRGLPLPEVEHGPHGRFHLEVPIDVGEQAMDRLRGCLNDTTLDKVRSRVVRMETAAAD